MNINPKNLDLKVVKNFGEEWKHYNQSTLDDAELKVLFSAYFRIFPFQLLNETSVGVDVGCGSGRWAKLMAPRVKKLFCIDASPNALRVAKSNLANQKNIEFIHASVGEMPLADGTLDFAYSLGVLHHIPDTEAGIKACVKKLKPGAPFLVYLYYAFDNKPHWFRLIWKASNYLRLIISKLPFKIKLFVTRLIATFVYYPLARFAKIMEKMNVGVKNFPLSSYRNRSFYTMRTDALDRFGTSLEHRFTQKQIIAMFENAGLEKIKIDNEAPYWCAVGFKPGK